MTEYRTGDDCLLRRVDSGSPEIYRGNGEWAVFPQMLEWLHGSEIDEETAKDLMRRMDVSEVE